MALRFSTGLRNSMLDTASFQDTLANGTFKFYPGTQPASADDAASGTLLVTLTVSSGAFTPGTATNGLNFGAASGGVVAKSSSEVWSGVASASGTVGWARFEGNLAADRVDGTTCRRFDVSVGTSGADINLATTTIASGATQTLDSFTVTLPAN